MWDSKPARANVPPAWSQLDPLKPVCKALIFVKIRTKSILPLISVSTVDCRFLRSSVISQTLSLTHVCPSSPYIHISLLLSLQSFQVALGNFLSGQPPYKWMGTSVRIRVYVDSSNLTLSIDSCCDSQSSFIRSYPDIWGLLLGLVLPRGPGLDWHPTDSDKNGQSMDIPSFPAMFYLKTPSDFLSLVLLKLPHTSSY